MTLPLPIPDELADRWRSRTTKTDGGHLEWVGARGISWHDKTLSHLGVGFAIRTGRAPLGSARQGCGHPGCIDPDHLQDDVERYRTRLMLRMVRGLPPVALLCGRGHDQAVDGRLDSDGDAYCLRCSSPDDSVPRIRLHGETRMRAALNLQANYEAGASIADLVRTTGRTYGYVHDLLALAKTRFRTPGYHAEFHAGHKDGAA